MSASSGHSPQIMGKAEFIALTAMMFALVAFSVDAMLPALTDIGRELSPDAPNKAQLIITSFVMGMGVGTFFAGPLSDSFGRKPVIVAGALLYCGGAAVAWASNSLEVILAARVVQGLGAAGPRVVSLAIVRDLYAGREMAKIMSIAMLIFTIVPALAPLIGAGIISLVGWRGIFLAFVLFISIATIWHKVRLVETLPAQDRLPFRVSTIWEAVKELFANPTVRLAIYILTLTFAMLFTMIMMVQPIYAQVYDRADSFPLWFGLIAIISGSASALNAAIVVRFGMRRLVTVTFVVVIALAATVLGLTQIDLTDTLAFGLFLVTQFTVFFMAGMTIGNLNAIAMEPVGHIAGIAASVVGGVSTVLSAALAAPVGMMFDGTIQPIVIAILVFSSLSYLLMRRLNRLETALGR